VSEETQRSACQLVDEGWYNFNRCFPGSHECRSLKS